MGILIVIGLIVVFIIVGNIAKTYRENADLHGLIAKKSNEREELIKSINALKNELEGTIARLKNELRETTARLTKENLQLKNQVISQEKWIDEQHGVKKQILDEIEKYVHDRAGLYKWLSPIIADINLLAENRLRDDSDFVKTKRNEDTQVRAEILKRQIKELTSDNNYLKYNLGYIKTLIPGVDDIIEDDENYEELKKEDNPKKYIPKHIYNGLSDTEKNILAFENYKKRKKSNWEIGRDYEMYIGYLSENNGWEVEYFGIEKKLEDLGRDLIAKKDNRTMIVQCKRWAENKIIHEKHIAQLFGTVEIYKFENPGEKNVKGIFITTATLSKKAKVFARLLNIEIMENVKMGEYPMIKCHNGRGNEYGERKKLYHLPMDQQYDKTTIRKDKGDCFAFTIEEAEAKGYERAYRWHSHWEDIL
jgi:hypothetical protein